MKKGIMMVAVCVLVLMGVFAGVNVSRAKESKVMQAYDKKVEQLKKTKKYKSGVAEVRFSCGKGEKILVVTPKDNVYGDGETISAVVYQFAGGKVKRIASVQSDGTAYPIMFTKDAILYGGHHRSGKLIIQNGKATLKEITNVYMESGKAVLTTYSVAKGEKTKISSKKISQKKAEKLDYYTQSKGAKMIEFK